MSIQQLHQLQQTAALQQQYVWSPSHTLGPAWSCCDLFYWLSGTQWTSHLRKPLKCDPGSCVCEQNTKPRVLQPTISGQAAYIHPRCSRALILNLEKLDTAVLPPLPPSEPPIRLPLPSLEPFINTITFRA